MTKETMNDAIPEVTPPIFTDTDIALIQESHLFNDAYYRAQTGYIHLSTKELIAIYLKDWSSTGIEPSLYFDGKHYQEIYRPDLNGMAPLLHFLKHGVAEGLNPWSDKTVLAWQESFINEPELAIDELTKSIRNWPKLLPKDEVHIHVHSKSHIVFQEFQHLLVSAFKQLDIDAKAVNETSHGKPRLRIIIAPHDYFFLEPTVDINTLSLSDSILFNTEQMTSVWFGRCYQFLRSAAGVVDINLQTAVCLNHLGISTRFLPLGRVQDHPLFQKFIPLPAEFSHLDSPPPLSGLSESKDHRPLDLVWIGSKAKRRQAFLEFAQPSFDAFKSFIRLVDVRGALSAGHPQAISALNYAALGQRTKILLNIHHFAIPYFEWQRLMHFGFMQGACVVTETVSRIPHLVPGEHYLQADLQHIPELVKWLLDDTQGRQTLESVRVKGYQKALQSFDLTRTLKELFIL